jgi:CheY-like chemotaxis protein
MRSHHIRQPIILVVEDYGDSREMLKLILEGEGYQVLTASNGDEALELAKHSHIDLILTDFGLPGMDGMALVRRIRKLSGRVSKLPIIMLTALYGSEYNQAALKAGCTDFLTKPVDLKKLQTMIERLLQEGSQDQEGGRDAVPIRKRES